VQALLVVYITCPVFRLLLTLARFWRRPRSRQHMRPVPFTCSSSHQMRSSDCFTIPVLRRVFVDYDRIIVVDGRLCHIRLSIILLVFLRRPPRLVLLAVRMLPCRVLAHFRSNCLRSFLSCWCVLSRHLFAARHDLRLRSIRPAAALVALRCILVSVRVRRLVIFIHFAPFGTVCAFRCCMQSVFLSMLCSLSSLIDPSNAFACARDGSYTRSGWS